MNLLVLGQAHDPHVAKVLPHLKFQNVRILDHYSLPKITIFSSSGGFRLFVQGEEIDLNAPTVIWKRIKPRVNSGTRSLSDESVEDDLFRQEGWKNIINPISEAFLNVRVLNNNFDSIRAQYKIFQAKVAMEVGFSTLSTLFSNETDFIEFIGEDIAYKILGSRNYPGSLGLTQRLSIDRIKTKEQNVRQVPSIFQPYCEKNFELRVICNLFEARAICIRSQENEKSETDWRADQFNIKYESYKLFKEIDLKCIKFLKRCKLDIGIFDFIVNLDGECVFLECNPDGQWSGYSEWADGDWEQLFADAINAARSDLCYRPDAFGGVRPRG